MLSFRCWIVDDNDAEIIIIRTSLIGPTYVPRYLQRISMETGKTPWGCQRKARSKEFNLQTRRQPGCQHKSERKEFKKGTICRFTFFIRPFKGQKFIQSIIFSFRHTESLQAAMFKFKKKKMCLTEINEGWREKSRFSEVMATQPFPLLGCQGCVNLD